MKLFKNSSSFGALLAASVIFSPNFASASDLLDGMLDQSADQPVHTYFQGLAVGVHGGGQFTAIDITDPTSPASFDGISADGVVGGAHIEYLFASGRFRVGPYAEGGWSNVNTEVTGGDLLHQDHYYGGGLKAGITNYGSTLVYGRVGYERAQWSSDAAPGEEARVDSWLVGGGVDTMIDENVSFGVGVDYLNWHDVDGDDDATDLLGDSEAFRGLARITWRR